MLTQKVTFPYRSLFHLGLSGLGVILLGLIIVCLQMPRLSFILKPSGRDLPDRAETQVRLEQARLAILEQAPDLGFRNLIADWTFLNFLQYFGNKEQRDITGYQLSGDYFEVIVQHDPHYYLPYVFLSSSVSIFAAQPERAVALQEQGLQHMTPTLPPESYFVWRHKGIDELLFLGDTEAARRSHEMAAAWAAQSPDPRAAEDQYTLRQTAEFLAQNPDSVRAQINAWAQVLSLAPDQKTREVAVRNIEALGGEIIKDEQGQYVIRYGEADNEE